MAQGAGIIGPWSRWNGPWRPERKSRRAWGTAAAVSAWRDLQRHDVLGLGTFLALAYGELNLLAFGQGAEPVALDGAEVNEHVGAVFPLNETEALGFVEEFDGAFGCN